MLYVLHRCLVTVQSRPYCLDLETWPLYQLHRLQRVQSCAYSHRGTQKPKTSTHLAAAAEPVAAALFGGASVLPSLRNLSVT